MEREEWLKLHPNAKIALMLKPMIGVLIFMVLLMLPMLGMVFTGDIPLIVYVIGFTILIIVLFLLIIIWAIMFYNRYLFRIGEDAVYINRGILWKRNVVIPYERIQHTSITRGPIDILLGLHILNLFTAGTGSVGARFGGAASAFAAEGSIPGLADPKPFQDAIMAKVRSAREDGLGVVLRPSQKTPTVTPEPVSPSTSNTHKEMLKELRKIREILEKGGRG